MKRTNTLAARSGKHTSSTISSLAARPDNIFLFFFSSDLLSFVIDKIYAYSFSCWFILDGAHSPFSVEREGVSLCVCLHALTFSHTEFCKNKDQRKTFC